MLLAENLVTSNAQEVAEVFLNAFEGLQAITRAVMLSGAYQLESGLML